MDNVLLSLFMVFFAITITHAGPIPEEFVDVAPEIRSTCLKESGADAELIERVAAGEFIPDDKIKCYLKCFLDQFRLVSSKGINYDAFLALTPPRLKEVAAKAAKACRDTTGKPGDLCDLSYNVVKCFRDASPEHYFIM